MLLVTAEQMRQADRQTIEEVGLPGIVLMENAAQGAARAIAEAVGEVAGLEVAAFCGRGNNGGDGLAICRILANRGALATAYLMCRGEDLRGDAAVNLRVARACGVRVVEVPDEEALAARQAEMSGHDLYLDALLGTGLNSPVRGRYAQVIELLNQLPQPVVAVDIPSGLSADTGRPLGVAVRADLTVTFGLVKLGLALEPGEHVGELHLVDISIPPAVVEGLGVEARLLVAEEVAGMLNPRPTGGHKGTFGHLMVVGGSVGKSGAPCLAAMGGLRAGAGLVTVALPEGLNPVAEVKLTAAMSQPLPQTSEGCLSTAALPVVLELARVRSALVLGPGLSTQEEAVELVRELVAQAETPLVIDADGLNALAGVLGDVRFASPRVVLTPHPGEAARLLECSVPEILADRPAAARELAERSGAVVILKGARSLIARPGGELRVCPRGNVLLASGGSGDVLSGVVGGLLSQGCGAWEAACAGAFLHGLAADLAAEDYGLRGLAAEELADWLPAAFAALEAPLEDEDEDHEPH
jgi:NAD(P)H-hydrate epimerase